MRATAFIISSPRSPSARAEPDQHELSAARAHASRASPADANYPDTHHLGPSSLPSSTPSSIASFIYANKSSENGCPRSMAAWIIERRITVRRANFNEIIEKNCQPFSRSKLAIQAILSSRFRVKSTGSGASFALYEPRGTRVSSRVGITRG